MGQPTAKGRQSSAKAQVLEPEMRRKPRQERAVATVDAIVQAAGEVFGDLGYAGATTNKIAARAGVSIGTLYQYFPDKDALVQKLQENHHHEAHEVIDKGLSRLGDNSVSLHAAISTMMTDLILLHEKDPKLLRFLGQVKHLGCMDHNEKEEEILTREVEKILSMRTDVRVSDTKTSAFVVRLTIGSLSRWMVHDAPESVDKSRIVEETATMVSDYLTG